MAPVSGSEIMLLPRSSDRKLLGRGEMRVVGGSSELLLKLRWVSRVRDEKSGIEPDCWMLLLISNSIKERGSAPNGSIMLLLLRIKVERWARPVRSGTVPMRLLDGRTT